MTRSRVPRAGGAALALADQALVSGTNFLTTVLLVRELGLDTFGVFSLIWLLVVLAVGLEQALVSQPLLTIAPKTADGSRAPYLGAVLVLQGAYTLLSALAAGAVYAAVLARRDDPVLAGTFLPVVGAVVAKQAHAFVRALHFAHGERRAALGNDLVAYADQLVLLGLLAAAGKLGLAAALGTVGACSGLAALLGLARHRHRRTTRAALADAARRHWRTARWLAAMQIAQLFASNSFLLAAGALLGVGAVGVIKAAHSVVGVLNLLFLAVENVVPVSAARLFFAQGRDAALRYLAWIGSRGAAVTAAVAGALVLFPRAVLEPLYGAPASDELVLALRALAALTACGFAISVLQIAFRTLERTRPVFLAYGVNTGVAVLAAPPVVERFGFAGAVVGMAAQQALMAGLLAAALAFTVRSSGRGRAQAVTRVAGSAAGGAGSAARP